MVQQTGEEGGVRPLGIQETYSDSATAVAIITGGTVATSSDVSRVLPAAAVTGIILAPGTRDGQVVTVVNQAIAARTLTPDGAVSNIADGATGSVIAGLTTATFVWDAATALWYHCV